VATGTGALLRELARRDVRPVRVIASDRSRPLLSGAGGFPRSWSRIQADARALPFPDGRFDVVTVCYMLHLLTQEDRICALREVHRVVRPGGRVVVVTVDAPSRELRWLLSALPSWTGFRRINLGAELNGGGASPRAGPLRPERMTISSPARPPGVLSRPWSTRGSARSSGRPRWCVFWRRRTSPLGVLGETAPSSSNLLWYAGSRRMRVAPFLRTCPWTASSRRRLPCRCPCGIVQPVPRLSVPVSPDSAALPGGPSLFGHHCPCRLTDCLPGISRHVPPRLSDLVHLGGRRRLRSVRTGTPLERL
jgi:SAM-dependent methyltransferase